MGINSDSTFYDLLNLSAPWQLDVIAYSKADPNIDFRIRMNARTLKCPICGRSAFIFGCKNAEFNYLNVFDYKTRITVQLPVIGEHNKDCKAGNDESVLSNTLLLDLLFKMVQNSSILKPLQVLFAAKQGSTRMKLDYEPS